MAISISGEGVLCKTAKAISKEKGPAGPKQRVAKMKASRRPAAETSKAPAAVKRPVTKKGAPKRHATKQAVPKRAAPKSAALKRQTVGRPAPQRQIRKRQIEKKEAVVPAKAEVVAGKQVAQPKPERIEISILGIKITDTALTYKGILFMLVVALFVLALLWSSPEIFRHFKQG